MFSRILHAQQPVIKNLHISPRFSPTRYDFLSRSKFSTPTSIYLYSSIDRLYAQNPVFAIVHDENVKVYLHMYNGNVEQNPSCAASCHNEFSHISPVFAYDFLSRCKFSTPSSTPLYISTNRLYAQNSVFAIAHDESMKVYLHMYNENVQQYPLCVESCMSVEFSISPRLSRTIFDPDPDANSVFLLAHLCTAVAFMRRKNGFRNCPREREGLYNGNVQQNPLSAASCH